MHEVAARLEIAHLEHRLDVAARDGGELAGERRQRERGACPGPTRLKERTTTAPRARAIRSAAALVRA